MTESLRKYKLKRNAWFFIDKIIINRLDMLSKKHAKARGHKMAIFANDYIGNFINTFGIYEQEELDTLFEFLSPLNDIFNRGLALDIGANIGNHSLYFSRKFLSVKAFEPNPSTYYLLRFNTDWADNISAHNIGLGSDRGVLKLNENSTNMGGSSLKYETNETIVEVNIEKLDHFDVDKSKLCFIKIDVEGFESNVIIGGFGTICEAEPIVVFEQHESEFFEGSTESINILRKIGYKFCWFQKGNNSTRFIVQRMSNLKEIIFGKTLTIHSGEKVPAGTHTMLLAVPPRFQVVLGVN